MLYEKGVFKTHSLGIPVISVGNISAGGTGKTQLVELLARHLRDKGRKVGVLSRGYGRKNSGYVVVSNGGVRCAEAHEAGDEPAQMAGNLEGVVIAVDEDRVRGARRMLAEFRPDILILDDGFQHRALGRTLDIVLLTAAGIARSHRLLPAGYGREPMRALARADVLVITGFSDRLEYEAAERRVRTFRKMTVGMVTRPAGLRGAFSGEPVRREGLKSRYVAVSGIGNPDSFERTLRSVLGTPAVHETFSDHHWYTESDVRRIETICGEHGAEYVVTTQKDAVRMKALEAARELDKKIRVLELPVTAVMTEGEKEILLNKVEVLS